MPDVKKTCSNGYIRFRHYNLGTMGTTSRTEAVQMLRLSFLVGISETRVCYKLAEKYTFHPKLKVQFVPCIIIKYMQNMLLTTLGKRKRTAMDS